jgi:hypothetical protein
MASSTGVGSRRRWIATTTASLGLTVITGCQAIGNGDRTLNRSVAQQPQVSEVAGWTRTVVTESYFLVVNVLPAEAMYSEAELAKEQPTEGELVLEGDAGPTGRDVRHVEVHVYDRQNGDALTEPQPQLSVLNRTTGERIDVTPTLMQDINIGHPDRHFGNNVFVRSNSDLSVQIQVGTERATVDGHLD